MDVEQQLTKDHSKGTPPFRFGWPERICTMLVLVFLGESARRIYNDTVAPTSVSNRSFAVPALALAVVISGYMASRFRRLPVSIRIFAWLAASVILYFCIGFALLLLTALVGEFQR